MLLHMPDNPCRELIGVPCCHESMEGAGTDPLKQMHVMPKNYT
jgi:hypothetical protein